jgi:hypothetical protein
MQRKEEDKNWHLLRMGTPAYVSPGQRMRNG